jgi:hypothetical protein
LAGHLLIKPGIWLALSRARLPALGRAAVESTGIWRSQSSQASGIWPGKEKIMHRKSEEMWKRNVATQTKIAFGIQILSKIMFERQPIIFPI